MASANGVHGPSASTRRATLAATFFAQGLLFIGLTTHLPQLKAMYGFTAASLSFVMLGMVVLAGLGSVTAEQVARRRDSAVALRVGLVLIAVGLACAGLLQREWLFLGAIAVYGLGVGIVDATGNMQAVALEHLAERPILPSLHAAWTLGGIVATLVALSEGHVHIAWAFVPLVVAPVVATAAPFIRRDHGEAATGTDLGGVPWRRIVLIGLALIVFYMVDTASSAWGPVFLNTTFGVSLDNVAVATMPYLVATLLARALGDRAVDRFGIVRPIQVGGVVSAVALAVIVFSPAAWVAVAGFAVLGLGIGIVAPLSFSAAAAVAGDVTEPAARRARVDAVIARFNQFNYVGALLGSVLTGLVGAGSLRVGFALPMVLVLAIIPLARSFRR